MQDRFNTAAGWVLFAGIVALGASVASGMYFDADGHPEVEEPGFFLEGGETATEEGAGYDLGTLLAAADPAAGEKIFAKCTACHTIDQGAPNGIGPNLWGVLGQPIGQHVAGFAYSSALAEHGGSWTYENMDAWLKSPKAFASGTKMSFAGLGKPEDRAAVMAFLKAHGGGPEFPAPVAPEAEAPAEGETATPFEGEAPSEAEAAGATAADEPVSSEQGATANENE